MKNSPSLITWCAVVSLLNACFSLAPPPDFSTDEQESDTDTNTCTDDACLAHDTDTYSDIDTDTDTDTDADTDTCTGDACLAHDTDTDTDTGIALLTCADGIDCNNPLKECAGADNVKRFETPGYCVDDDLLGATCDYVYVESLSCNGNGCTEETGVCDGDPCIGVTCPKSSGRECDADGKTLWVWGGSPGVCTEALCEYERQSIECEDACEQNQCTDDPCAGLICAMPPASFCDPAESDSLWQFAAEGTTKLTADGCECVYTLSMSICPHICLNGACADPE